MPFLRGPGLSLLASQRSLVSQAIAMFGGGKAAGGSQGSFLRFSNAETLFQDSAGTIPVTAVGQPIGRQLDLSGNGNYHLQATETKRSTYAGTVGTLGSELVSNGDFASDTVWTKGTGWTISGGTAVGTTTTDNLSQAVSLTADKSYQLTYTITVTGGTVAPLLTGTTTSSGVTRSASGTYTEVIRANTGNTTLEFDGVTSFTGTIDNVSLKEVQTWVGPYGALFDGVDDGDNSVATIDWSHTDEITMVVGVRKLSDILVGQVLESSTSTGSINGTFAMFAPQTAATAGYRFRSRGSASADAASASSYAAPHLAVLSGQGKITTDLSILRVNGVQDGTSATDQVTTAWSSRTMYRGARNNSSNFMNGLIYTSFVIDRLLSASDLAIVEALVASDIGVAL